MKVTVRKSRSSALSNSRRAIGTRVSTKQAGYTREVRIPGNASKVLHCLFRPDKAETSSSCAPEFYYLNSNFYLDRTQDGTLFFSGHTTCIVNRNGVYLAETIYSGAKLTAWPHYLAGCYCLQYSVESWDKSRQYKLPDRLIITVDDRRPDFHVAFTNTGFAVVTEAFMYPVRNGATLRIYGGSYPWIGKM